MTPQFGALAVGLTEFGSFDSQALLHRVGEDLEASASARIAAKRDPKGDPWAPWSPQYAKSRGVRRMLDRTGALRASLTHTDTDTNLRVGVTAFYGRFLHRGSERGPRTLGSKASLARRAAAGIGKHSKNMPARRFLGVSTADEDQILVRIGEAIEAQVARVA